MTHTRTALMAGVATLSLTSAVLASEFSNFLVFGDRQLDAGQFVDDLTVFPEDPDAKIETDGRGRFTNRDADGNTGHTWSTRVSRTLGHGDTHPSQPQTLDNSPPVKTGTNFAAGFFSSLDVLQSVSGFPVMSGIIYEKDGETRSVEGTSRAGLLTDPETRGWAANSIVLMNGGSRDIRNLANIDGEFGNVADLSNPTNDRYNGTRLVRDAETREAIARAAAGNIAQAATEMQDAGAALVVVSNLMDMGAVPEISGEQRLAEAGLEQLRETYGADLSVPMTEDDARARDILNDILANPGVVAEYRTEGTNHFNEELAAGLDGRNGIVLIDQRALVADIMADPVRFGISGEENVGQDCLYDGPILPCNEVEGFAGDRFFLNGVDLTTTAHAMLADHAASIINAPVVFSGVPLTAIASSREIADAGIAQVQPERIKRRGWAPFVSGGLGSSTLDQETGEGKNGAMRISGVAGVTYSLGNGIALGAAAGYQDVSKSVSETVLDYDGAGLYGTVFAGADFGMIFGNASATVGQIDYDRLSRIVKIGDAVYDSGGESEASVVGASLEVGARTLVHGTLAAGPIASVEHWSASVDGVTEDGADFIAVSYDDIDASSTRASLGLFLEAGDLDDPGMPAVFRVKALYTRELQTDGVDVTARAASSPSNAFTREGNAPDADSMAVGAQLTFDFGPFLGSVGYDAQIGESTEHAGRIDISVPLGGR